MAQLIKTKGWIFVDDNQLHITVIDKPYWVESEKYWRAKNGTELLPRELFPDMKQEDTPIEVEISVNSLPAKQQKQQTIEKACEWIVNNVNNSLYYDEHDNAFIDTEELITAFKEYMEEEK